MIAKRRKRAREHLVRAEREAAETVVTKGGRPAPKPDKTRVTSAATRGSIRARTPTATEAAGTPAPAEGLSHRARKASRRKPAPTRPRPTVRPSLNQVVKARTSTGTITGPILEILDRTQAEVKAGMRPPAAEGRRAPLRNGARGLTGDIYVRLQDCPGLINARCLEPVGSA